jgi:4-amino-4-deoxy-L-arabinose transferase-like glycosyltransferase
VVRPEADRRADRSGGGRLWLIVGAVTVARLVAAAAIPLTEDEAYYRLWAQHLQAGYLDHPPMIAWWIRLGQLIAGDTALGVRLIRALATGLTTWLIGDLARRLGLSLATGERAALWYNATFTVALGGLLATPDTPACLFWTLAVWCLARQHQSGDGRWWLGAGAAAGLSCLSKYSGLFLAPGVFVSLLLAPGGLKKLTKPWPWHAAIVAVLVLAPNVVWNAAHDWLTFDKQFGRVGAKELHLGRLPEFLVTQFLLLNPIIAVLAGRGIVRGWKARRTDPDLAVLLPIAVAAPFILYLIAHSLHDRVQGHWPVPVFGALVICAAYAAERSRPWVRSAVPILGFGLSLLALVHLATPSPRLGDSDPALHLRAWPEFAAKLETLRLAEGATWVGTKSYGVAAQLDAAGRIRSPIVQIEDRERYFAWQKGADLSGPGLVLDLARRMKAEDLQRCFAEVTPLGEIDRGAGRSRWTRYAVFRVAGPKVDVLTQGCP